MLTKQELSALLRDHGYKVTPQRLAVYEELARETWHPNAEMLYQKLRAKYPALSFATVYKTVEILRAAGAIKILHADEDSYRYDANICEHHHLLCTQCGAMHDFAIDADVLEKLHAQARGESGFAISSGQIYFYGLCPQCREFFTKLPQ